MSKWFLVVAFVFGLMVATTSTVFAEDEAEADGGATATPAATAPEAPATGGQPLLTLGAAIGAGIVMLGAAFGIARIGSAAVESMSRQPQVAGNIQTAMIIAAALIEGATFFALIVCWFGK